jgi:hypothetical protein
MTSVSTSAPLPCAGTSKGSAGSASRWRCRTDGSWYISAKWSRSKK